MNENVEDFIRIVVKQIRDEAIQSCDGVLRSLEKENMSVTARRWKKARDAGKWQELLEMVIADSVDDAVFQLLYRIDDGVLPLQFRGSDLSVDGAGEMAGSFMSEWRETLSSERWYDDLSEL